MKVFNLTLMILFLFRYPSVSLETPNPLTEDYIFFLIAETSNEDNFILKNYYCDINDYRGVYVSESIEGWLGVYPDNGPKFLGLASDGYETYWFFQTVTDPEYLFWEDDKIYYAKGKWLEGSGVDTYPIYNLSDIYQVPDVWPVATSVSPDGKYIYLSRPVPYDIFTEENPNYWEQYSNMSLVSGHIFKYDTVTGEEKRLTYSYTNDKPVLSNDGRFIIYSRLKTTGSTSRKYLILCAENGEYKYSIFSELELARNNYYGSKYYGLRFALKGIDRAILVQPSFCRIAEVDDGFLTYYYTTPIYEVKEEDPDENWTTIRIKVERSAAEIDLYKTFSQREFYYKYSFDVIDLGIPYGSFDYVLDVRFRFDGRYVSLVGVKDEVRKLYIYDLKEEELHEVEGSEGALTARWLEIIE